MKFSGQIHKMQTQYDKPIQYFLNLSHDIIHVNKLINKDISIEHIGYQCVSCGSEEPIFRMGFCKKCFYESPMAGPNIISPELSTAHLGIAQRDLEFEKKLELQPHIVYLAYTGDVKVGVTRFCQIPTRWIDQGASLAIPIAKTNNRYEAGVIEVELKKHFPDKTNWRKMLQNGNKNDFNLVDYKENIKDVILDNWKDFYVHENKVWSFEFPYAPAEKVHSLSLEKQKQIEGKLIGIKGQYLEFEVGNFINIRSHEGYVIDFEILK